MRFVLNVLLCGTLLALAACQSTGGAFPPDTNRMTPAMAPTPFSAEEIRAGCPDGRKLQLEIEAMGHETQLQELTFSNGDALGTSVNGQRVTWQELQSHASFAADSVEVTNEKLETPLGELDCWQYTVTESEAGRVMVRRYWFAKALAGPPVYLESKIDGIVVQTMTMVARQ